MIYRQIGKDIMLKKILEFGHLVRFSHTLFAMPFALASMWVASNGFQGMAYTEVLKLVLLIVGCMITARNGAMSFNRLADADYDAKNPRTASRHLPAGKIKKKSVIAFVIVNGALFILFAYFLNFMAFVFALPVFLLLLSYSFWKRFSFLCHWYLGFAIGMSPLGAWIAVRGEFSLFPIMMSIILALWMGGFDIIYATQDEKIDRETGLHSVPARFGRVKALRIALVSHLLMLIVCTVFGFYYKLGIVWMVVVLLMTASIIYIHLFRKTDDLDAMNRDFFLANVLISVLVMIGLIIRIMIGGSIYGLV